MSCFIARGAPPGVARCIHQWRTSDSAAAHRRAAARLGESASNKGNLLVFLAKFILFGEGDIAPLTHEILRQAELNRERRPAMHGG
jgi:hypothetical protein